MPLFTGYKFGFGNPNTGGGAAEAPTAATFSGSASGGTKSTFGEYTVHVFTTNGTFTVSSGSGTIDYLCVAGGGGGGCRGGGGGAGGLRSTVDQTGGSSAPEDSDLESAVPVTPGPYSIAVGEGGNGQPLNVPGTAGVNGSNSSIAYNGGTITSTGGGGGCSDGSQANSGGSGGGGGNGKPGQPGTAGQGYAGGDATGNSNAGGGGAGAIGGDGPGPTGTGPGGIGVQVSIAGPPTGSPIGTPGPSGNGWFAGGGGGGGGGSEPISQPNGGAGGGGSSETLVPGNPTGGEGLAGTTNSGGGGGAGSGFPNRAGGNGGSGIVVIRYPS